MTLECKNTRLAVLEQGAAAEAALDPINEMINNITKTVVFFLLHPGSLCRNG